MIKDKFNTSLTPALNISSENEERKRLTFEKYLKEKFDLADERLSREMEILF